MTAAIIVLFDPEMLLWLFFDTDSIEGSLLFLRGLEGRRCRIAPGSRSRFLAISS